MKAVFKKMVGATDNSSVKSATSGETKPKDKKKVEQQKKKTVVKPPVGTGKKKETQKAQGKKKNPDNQKTRQESPFVSLGPISREFASTNVLGKKSITVDFNLESGVTDIFYCFSRQEGLIWGKPEKLSSDEYMRVKNILLKKDEVKSKWFEFVSKTLDRLDLDLTKSIPQIHEGEVIKFVKSHYSPLEKTLIDLSLDEWNRIDAKNLSMALGTHRNRINECYPDKSRQLFLQKAIEGKIIKLIDPPAWSTMGIFITTKQSVLNDFKLINKVDPKKAEILQSLNTLLEGSEDVEEFQGEEEKVEESSHQGNDHS